MENTEFVETAQSGKNRKKGKKAAENEVDEQAKFELEQKKKQDIMNAFAADNSDDENDGSKKKGKKQNKKQDQKKGKKPAKAESEEEEEVKTE